MIGFSFNVFSSGVDEDVASHEHGSLLGRGAGLHTVALITIDLIVDLNKVRLCAKMQQNI